MWSTVSCLLFVLTMLTNTYADRGRPTLKDVERFGNGSVRASVNGKCMEMNGTYIEPLTQTIQLNIAMVSGCDKNFSAAGESGIDGLKMLKEGQFKRERIISRGIDPGSDLHHVSKAGCNDYMLLKQIQTNPSIVCVVFGLIIYCGAHILETILILHALLLILCVMLWCIRLHVNFARKRCFFCTSNKENTYASSVEKAVPNTVDNSGILDKCSNVTVYLDNDSCNSVKSRRSRYEMFVVKYNCCRVRRDREPSRIPVKQLIRALGKKRSVRRLVRRCIKKNVPRSSHVHSIILRRFDLESKAMYMYSDQVRYMCVHEPRKKSGCTSRKKSSYNLVKISHKRKENVIKQRGNVSNVKQHTNETEFINYGLQKC